MRIPKFTYFFSLLQGARWAGFRPPPSYVVHQDQYTGGQMYQDGPGYPDDYQYYQY